MFGTDKNIENLQQLLVEVKKYVELQRDYIKLDIVEKLTVLLSTLILVLIMLILGMIALFYLSFTLAYILEPHVGGLTQSYAIISACIIFLIIVVTINRKRFIERPLVRFLVNLFLKK